MRFALDQAGRAQSGRAEAVVAAEGGCGAAVCVSVADVTGLSEERLAGLAATSEALASGDIPQDHARLIARASSESAIDEEALVEAAKEQDYDEFEKTLRRQQQDLSGDDGMAVLENQKQKRTARMFNNRDTAMFILSAEFDPSTGQHLAAVAADKARELWRKENPKARRTPQQRTADALAELILEPGKGKTKGIALVLVADYDTTKQELVNARFCNNNPPPIPELVHLALKADPFPAVFNAKTQNLWLGRTRRTATDAQRIALTRTTHQRPASTNPVLLN